jgi:hypothetical protein
MRRKIDGSQRSTRRRDRGFGALRARSQVPYTLAFWCDNQGGGVSFRHPAWVRSSSLAGSLTSQDTR